MYIWFIQKSIRYVRFHSSSPEVGGFQRAVSDPQIEQSFAEAMQPYCFVIPICDITDPYRRTDGQCNNLINPLLGSSQTPQQRILPNAYDNCKFVTSTEDCLIFVYLSFSKNRSEFRLWVSVVLKNLNIYCLIIQW